MIFDNFNKGPLPAEPVELPCNCKTTSRWLAKPGERTCNECEMYDECVEHQGDDRHYNNCRVCKSFKEKSR